MNLPSNLPDQPERDASVCSWEPIDGLLQPSLQPEELLWAEEVCKKDPKVKAACEAVGIAQDAIAVDGMHLILSRTPTTSTDADQGGVLGMTSDFRADDYSNVSFSRGSDQTTIYTPIHATLCPSSTHTREKSSL